MSLFSRAFYLARQVGTRQFFQQPANYRSAVSVISSSRKSFLASFVPVRTISTSVPLKIDAELAQQIKDSALSGAVAPNPPKDGEPNQYPEKIKTIVDQITTLSIFEIMELNEALAERLGLPKGAMTGGFAMGGGFASGGGAPAAAAPSAAAAEAPKKEEPKQEKTSFRITLEKVGDGSTKVKFGVLKIVRQINPDKSVTDVSGLLLTYY